MTQPNLFPSYVNKQKQSQRAAVKPLQAAQPSSPANRPVVPQKIHSQERTFAPQQPRPIRSSNPAVRPQPQPSHTIRLSGRVGRYFDVKQTQSGKSLATFSLATQRSYRDESGNWLKQTVWQRIVAWGETAQSLSQLLHKGARVAVEGRFKTREWTDRENNLHTTTELVARQVQFMDMAGA